jgi:glycosyltransferase involved in cell wall biosynthesis
MDVVYFRLESKFPGIIKRVTRPAKILNRKLLSVWEFNTIPEFARMDRPFVEGSENECARFQRAARTCDLAICVSKALGDWVQATLKIKRVAVVPNGSDPEVFRRAVPLLPRMKYVGGGLRVLWMGSGKLPWHDLEILARTAAFFWESGRKEEIIFYIIGNGTGIMRNMSPNVHYLGMEEYAFLPGWLAAMDVGLCLYKEGPADFGSPLKLFDYMASGLAVVSTEHPQIREVLTKINQQEQIIPRGDARALAAVLLRLAEDRSRVVQLGESAREAVKSRYNWQRAIEDTFTALQEARRA